MRIVIPGINASQSQLGKSMPLISGLPADGLAALYLFNEGVDGQSVSSFSDTSGNGRHASLHGSWAAPVKRSWGLEVQSADGLILNTGVPVGQQSTVILAVESLLGGGEASAYQFFFGVSANNYPPAPSSTVTNLVSPAVNFNGTVASGDYALFDGTTGQSVLGAIRLGVVGGPTRAQPAVLGLRIDAAANTMRLRANTGTERVVTRPEIGAHYATDRGTIMIGAWKNQNVKPAANPNARIYGAAIYDRTLTDDLLTIAMLGIRRRAEQAGIVFA